MRLPIPRNRLVALALIGAVLTAAVAIMLVVPGLGVRETADSATQSVQASDAGPTPNGMFTPAVQSSGGQSGEHAESEDHEGDEEHEEAE